MGKNSLDNLGVYVGTNIQAALDALTSHTGDKKFGERYNLAKHDIITKNAGYDNNKAKDIYDAYYAGKRIYTGITAALGATIIALQIFGDGKKGPNPNPENPKPSIGAPTYDDQDTTTIYYTVNLGDTLSAISSATGIFIKDIETQNPFLHGRDLWVGDVLSITVPTNEIDHIINNLAENGLKGSFELPTKTTSLYYKVGSGDYLENIAKAFGVTVQYIYDTNWDISNLDHIKPGQILLIKTSKTLEQIKGLNGKAFATLEEAENYVPTQETKPIEPVEEESKPSVTLPEGYEIVIDFSSRSGKPNWDELGAAYERGEFTGIILRLAENSKSSATNDYAFALDKEFETNLQECNKRGIPYGVYIFTRGYTLERIEAQANDSVNYLESLKSRGIPFKPSYPIYGDFEKDANRQYELLTNGKYDTYVNHMIAFGDIIEGAGYFYGAYHNLDVLKQVKLASNYEELLKDQLWLAGGYSYNSKLNVIDIDSKYIFTELDGNKGMLQITKHGIVPGFNGTLIDINIASSDLRKTVTNFYKSKYGDDYYKGTTEPSLRGTQIRYAPSRPERRHPGTTIEGVTTALTKATFDLKEHAAAKSKSVVNRGQGNGIKYTKGNHGIGRARAKQYPYQRTFKI